jgi:hypothetical protein
MPDAGDRDALQQFVAEQRSSLHDPAHPMWRRHLLQGYGGGSSLVTRSTTRSPTASGPPR